MIGILCLQSATHHGLVLVQMVQNFMSSHVSRSMQYEMCMGTHPFTAKNEGALIRKILKGQYKDPTGYSSELLNILKLCLIYNATKRPSASTLLARPEVVRQSRLLATEHVLRREHKLDSQLTQQCLDQEHKTPKEGNAQDWNAVGSDTDRQQQKQPQRHPFALVDVHSSEPATVYAEYG